MKLTSALALAALANLAAATWGHDHEWNWDWKNKDRPNVPYCGTTTITEMCKTATKTSYSHFPTVTATVTKKKNFCQAETTKTTTEVLTVFKETKVFVTPTITSTIIKPKVTEVITKTATVTGCPKDNGPGKRHFLEQRTAEADEEAEEEDEYAGLTNAERIRRGLPLAKPADKRTFCKDGKCGPKPPVQAGPSCVPKTEKVEITKTITKSVTPTKYVTTTKCGHTQTATSTVCVTTETTKWNTKTKTADPTTVFTKVTPTKTATVHATITVPPKNGCKK